MKPKHTLLAAIGLFSLFSVHSSLFLCAESAETQDPLPNWADGPVKQGILDFVKRVTDKNSPDYVVPSARVASFNNDGVLWPERPYIEGIFALGRMRALLPQHPEWRAKQPFKAILANDRDYLARAGNADVTRFLRATHSGITELEFDEQVGSFFSGKEPFLEKPYTKLAYVPMLELLRHLEANGFINYINTAGDVEFARAVAMRMFHIPPQRVIGSTLGYTLEASKDGRVFLKRSEKLDTYNNGDQKAVSFRLATGRHPLIAVGRVRSGDDVSVLRYSHSRPGASLQLVIQHDDPIREYEYSEAGGATLAAAKKYNWTVVKISRDWQMVFDESK